MARLSRPAVLRADVQVLVGYLALSLLLTGGMLLHPGSELAANTSDVSLLSWFLAHDAHALAHGGHELLVSDDLNAPLGVNLMWNTALMLPGVLLAPLTWLTSGRTTFAVLLWLGPALSAYSLHIVLGKPVRGRALIAARPARVVAGLVFGFSPALLAQALGHLQLVLLPLVPVILWLVVEAAVGQRRAVTVGVAAGAAAAAQLLTGEEALFVTALVALMLLAALAASRWREVTGERLRRLAIVSAVALGAFLVLAGVPLAVQFLGSYSVHGSAFTRDYFKLDVSAFTTPTRALVFASADSLARSDGFRGGPEEHTGFLGLPALAVAALMLATRWGDLRVRIPLLIAAVLSVLALGEHPIVANRQTAGVTLPWHRLADLPLFEALILTRLPVWTALLLAVALAAYLERPPRGSRAVAVLLAALVLVPLAPRPLAVNEQPAVPSYFTSPDGVRALPRSSVVLVAPMAGYGHAQALDWQRASGFHFRLVGGYFIGPSYDGRALIGPLPRMLPVLLEEVRTSGRARELTAQVRADVAADLRYYRPAAVVVGPMAHRASAVGLLRELLGSAPEQLGGVAVWRLQD